MFCEPCFLHISEFSLVNKAKEISIEDFNVSQIYLLAVYSSPLCLPFLYPPKATRFNTTDERKATECLRGSSL